MGGVGAAVTVAPPEVLELLVVMVEVVAAVETAADCGPTAR